MVGSHQEETVGTERSEKTKDSFATAGESFYLDPERNLCHNFKNDFFTPLSRR